MSTTTATLTYTHTVLSTHNSRLYAGVIHAANREGWNYRTLCGRAMHSGHFHCFADEPHQIECVKCRKVLGM